MDKVTGSVWVALGALQARAAVKAMVMGWFGTPERVRDIAIKTLVQQWIAHDKRTHTMDDGTTAGGRYYDYAKSSFGSPEGIFWGPLLRITSAAQRDLLLHDAEFQEMMRSEKMTRQFQLVGNLIRDNYPNEHGALFAKKYNHHFLTEDSTGKIVAMNDDAIVALFRKPEGGAAPSGDAYPRLLITSSHARGESLADVTSITHGLESLARDSHAGKKLDHGHVDTGVKLGQTLTLYACDVEENPMLNAAALLRRILELKRIAKTGEEDTFTEVSPGAKRIAKLMLKCMVEDPTRIDTKDERLICDSAKAKNGPIVLRKDAIDIANHFQLVGYSKGGNVVSDAMRYLIHELKAVNPAHRTPVFAVQPRLGEGKGPEGVSQHSIRDIVRGISVMAIASIEVEMAEEYKKHGVRRVAFNNKNDIVSANSNYQSKPYDERYLIDGVIEEAGHNPEHMLGTRGDEVADAIVGYAHQDGRVTRRLMEFFAPNYGDVAIGHVHFDERAKEGIFTIEAASGSTDAQFTQYLKSIKDAFLHQRLHGIKIEHAPYEPGQFTVHCAPRGGVVDFSKNAGALQKVRAAFTALRASPENPVVTARIENEINTYAREQEFAGFEADGPAPAGRARRGGASAAHGR